ncbi:MAG TPA: hypothetical protein VFQ78_16030, partial [Candidatus Udaeobacter sp.]|nr:hypothetical protein [Candidatus Udaeobacter sp.]
PIAYLANAQKFVRITDDLRQCRHDATVAGFALAAEAKQKRFVMVLAPCCVFIAPEQEHTVSYDVLLCPTGNQIRYSFFLSLFQAPNILSGARQMPATQRSTT